MAQGKRKNVAWIVQILRIGKELSEGTLTIRPHKDSDRFSYKKILSLYHEVKKNASEKGKEAKVWLVGIDKQWRQKNIFYFNPLEDKRKR